MRRVPSFFLTNTTFEFHGEHEGLMMPASRRSAVSASMISSSCGERRYVCALILFYCSTHHGIDGIDGMIL